LDEGYIDVETPTFEESGDLGQEDRSIVCLALRYGFSNIRTNKKGIVPEIMFELRVNVRRVAEG
jgi:hypothetical protein